MLKLTMRKLRVVAALSSAVLFATAFTAGGCTINIDQELLDQLGGLLSSVSDQAGFGGSGSWGECPNENDDCDSPWDGSWDQEAD